MNKEKLVKIFSAIPVIETERLVLRAMSARDSADMFDYSSRGELTKYLLWSPHNTVNYTREYLAYIEKRYKVGDFYDWAVVEKESGRMIGTCGFTSIDLSNRRGEIGYVLNPDFHRRGYAPEAARAVIEFGFARLDLNRIEARFMEGNDASRRVAEKLGMTFEGYTRDAIFVKGAYRTVGTCAILHREFENQLN
jgi:ribosomal-protein-alanine N-acetyltransferase